MIILGISLQVVLFFDYGMSASNACNMDFIYSMHLETKKHLYLTLHLDCVNDKYLFVMYVLKGFALNPYNKAGKLYYCVF